MARGSLPEEVAFEQSPPGSETAILERNILERSSKCEGRGRDTCVWGAAGRHVSWEASNSQDHPGSLAPWPRWRDEDLGFGEVSSPLFVCSVADM